MKKIPILIFFTLVFISGFSQLLSKKVFQLPGKLNSIDFLPKERLVLSPDGSLLCFMNETAPYQAYLINSSTGVIEDSIGISSYGPQIKWSGDSKTIIFYTESYTGSKFTLYSRKGDLKGIIETAFPVLNFETDSTASEIAAIMYDLPETGAAYSSDVTGAYIYPKGIKYIYKFNLFDVATRMVKDSFLIKTTYPRIATKWKDKWTLLICESDAEFQAYTYAATVDLSTRKIVPIGNSKDLFVNEPFMNMQMLSSDELYISKRTEVYKLDERIGKFKSILQAEDIESIALQKNGDGLVQLITGDKGKRWVENKVNLVNTKNEKRNVDIKDVIPHLVSLAGDTVSVIMFSKSEAAISKYSILQNTAEPKPEILVQNSIEPDTRLLVPNTSFVLEYSSKAWQVTDLSSQLIVHQQNEFENYGTKFTTAGNNPFIIKYNTNKAVLIPIGKWNEVAGNIQLQHPLLSEGSAVYSQTVSLNSLAYNSSTSLLTGIFYSYDYYYAAAWDLRISNSAVHVIKLERKKIATDKTSSFSKGSSPLLLAEVAYLMKESDWKGSGEGAMLDRLKKFTARIPSSLITQLNEMNDYSWEYNIELGKATGNFSYQDSIYGHLVIDLVQPSRSVYFCHKELKGGFSALRFVPYKTEGYGSQQIALSDKGNFVTVSNLGYIGVYDLQSNQYLAIAKDVKDQGFDGSAHFFVEQKAILLGNKAWYSTAGLNPVHTLSRTLYFDSVDYFPEKKLFVAHTAGRKGQITVHLDNLTISATEESLFQLQRPTFRDTVIRHYFPEKQYWMIAGRRGLGYDSSQKMTPEYMGRLFSSTLSGSINFIQMFPEVNKVLIGNTDESVFEYWDALTEQRIFKLVITDENNFIIQGTSGYYFSTPNALRQIGFLQKGEAIPASFLDAGLNRPDIVLAGMFDTTETATRELVQIYRKAAQLKNKKNALIFPGKSPAISLAEFGNTLLKEKDVAIKAKVAGVENPVNYFSIQINNVLVWDTSLLKPVSSVEINKTIQLSSGENQIVFQAKDAGGYASVPVFQRMVFQPEQKQGAATYIIALAVNKHSDDSRNLKYAVKDGKDILTAFRSVEGATVITDSLFDEAFTAENIGRLKEKLMQTTIEDKVIVSFSGHGMLDDSLNFYLATYDMDFENPRKKGLAFSVLEELLTAIPARKKLLLIDACNSGNIDKEANQPAEVEETLVDKVRIQSDTIKSARGVELPIPANTDLQQVINQLFVSSSSKGGIEVIAATAGNAFAYEAPEWNNGVFTYALLQTFRDNSDLDKNFDGQISIKEIKKFVYPKVVELTNGLQQPLSRYENPNYDWNLIPMRYD